MLLAIKWKEFVANNPFKADRNTETAAPVVVSVKTPTGSPATPQQGKIFSYVEFFILFLFVLFVLSSFSKMN